MFNLLSGLGCFAAIRHTVCLLFGGKYKDRRCHQKSRSEGLGLGRQLNHLQAVDQHRPEKPAHPRLSCDGELAAQELQVPATVQLPCTACLSSVGQPLQHHHVMPAREGPVCFPREGSHPQFTHRPHLRMQEAVMGMFPQSHMGDYVTGLQRESQGCRTRLRAIAGLLLKFSPCAGVHRLPGDDRFSL